MAVYKCPECGKRFYVNTMVVDPKTSAKIPSVPSLRPRKNQKINRNAIEILAEELAKKLKE